MTDTPSSKRPVHSFINVYARLDSYETQLFMFRHMTDVEARDAADAIIKNEFLSLPGNENIDEDSLEIYTELIVASESPITHYD